MSRAPRRGLFPILAVAQSAAISLALTWPAVLDPGRVVLGSPGTDTVKHLWTLWWFRTSLLRDGALPLHTEYLNFPQGMELWPIEPLNGIVAVLLFPLSLVLVNNLLVLFNLTATGLCGILLGREVSGGRLGGHLSGLVLQTSSFSLNTIFMGVGELQHLWLLPLAFFLLIRAKRTLAWRYSLATGVVLGLGSLACFYYGLFMALGLSVLACPWLLRRDARRRRLVRLALMVGTGVALALPPLYGFASSYGPSHGRAPSLRVLRGQDPISRDYVRSFARPSAMLVEWAPRQPRGDYEDGRLLGIPVLLLGLAALVRRPRQALVWWMMVVLGLALAIGPSVGGPFRLVDSVANSVGLTIHFPSRFLALVHTALAALAGLAVAGTQARLRWAALGVVALSVGHARARALLPALPSFELVQLPCLRGLEPGGAILDLAGYWFRGRKTRATVIAAQIAHERPIQAIPLDRLYSFALDGASFAGSLDLVLDAESPPTGSGKDYRADFFVLREAGFTQVLAIPQGGKGPLEESLLSFLTAQLGPAEASCGGVALFDVPSVEATEEQAAAWRQEHARRKLKARQAIERGERPGPVVKGMRPGRLAPKARRPQGKGGKR